MKTAICYARLSSLAGDELSIERQIDLCTSEAKARGLRPEIMQEPEGQRSGRSDKQRPAWRMVIERVRSDPNIGAVIVADLFRASRSVRGMAEFLELCQKRGVTFVPLKEKQMFDMSTAGGKAMVNMLTALGQFYADDISDRMRIYYKHLRNAGVWIGKVPQGLKLSGKGTSRKLIASKEKYRKRTYLETVRAFFRLYVGAKPIGLYLAAILLNEKGYRVRTNAGAPRKIERGVLRQMLDSVQAYQGVLPDSLIDQVCRRTQERKRRLSNGRRMKLPPALGWGIVYCATCKHKYYLGRQKDRTYYRHDRGDCPDEQWIADSKIDSQLIDLATRLLSLTDGDRQRIAEQISKQDENVVNVGALRSQLKRLELGYIKEIISEETYIEQRAELLHQIERPKPRPRSPQESLRYLDSLSDLIAKSQTLDPYLANRSMRDIFSRVEIKREKIVSYQITPQLQPLFAR